MYKIIQKSTTGITETPAVFVRKNKQYIFLDIGGNVMQFDRHTKKYCGLNDFISHAISYKIESLFKSQGFSENSDEKFNDEINNVSR